MRRLATLGLALALLVPAGCKRDEPEGFADIPYSDDFERETLGPHWWPSGGHWTIRDGYAYTTGANNAPLFLKAKLPDDVVVEVDVMSETRDVDSKIELMTDGRTHQSGYIFILGGWDNTISTIARLDEHGKDRVEKRPTGVQGKKKYRWRIEKQGGDIDWYIDGDLYLELDDPEPLEGEGHNRLAFSNWQNRIRYDNLRIWPHDEAPPVSTSTAARR